MRHGAPSAGPYNLEGRPVLRLDGPSYAPWAPEEVVDPEGFRVDTIERRLSRDVAPGNTLSARGARRVA